MLGRVHALAPSFPVAASVTRRPTLFVLVTCGSSRCRTPRMWDVKVVSEQYMHADHDARTLAGLMIVPWEIHANTLILI